MEEAAEYFSVSTNIVIGNGWEMCVVLNRSAGNGWELCGFWLRMLGSRSVKPDNAHAMYVP